MRKNDSYCLFLCKDEVLALRLGPGDGDFEFAVELYEKIGAVPANNVLQRELAHSGKRQMLLLPNDRVHLLHARLPELKPRELQRAFLGLIRKYKGAGNGGWTFDRHLRGSAGSGDSQDTRRDYTGLFVEQDHIEAILRNLAGDSLKPQHAIPLAVALDALLRRELRDSKAAIEAKAWNLVYLGHDEFFLTVGDHLGPLFFRDLPRDLSGGKDQDEYMKRLATEVERSNFFAKQGDQSVQVKQIRIAGNPELVAALMAELQESKGLDVEHWRPELRFAFDGKAAPWDMLLPLAGAAVIKEPRLLKLGQRSDGQRLSRKWRAYAGLALATALVAILPLLGGAAFMTRAVQERAIESQEQQLLAAENKAKHAANEYLLRRGLLDRQARMASIGNPPDNLGEILRDVADRIPGHVRLNALELSKSDSGKYQLLIVGESRGESSDRAQAVFLAFKETLAQCPYLASDKEPVFLKIGEDSDRVGASKVSFSLEYVIRESELG